MLKNWWLKEIVGILFKLHPVVLLLAGLLDANETFLVLAVSYLASGIVSLLKSTFVIGYDYTRIRLPQLSSTGAKISETLLYFIGWVFMLFYSTLLMVLFFGILYDAVERQDYTSSLFDGKEGAVLAKSLLINGSYFLLIELLQFRKFILRYSVENHHIGTAYAFGFDFRRFSKWSKFQLIWLFVFYAFFLFMCTGFAFGAAIASFFVFDLGIAVTERMELRDRGQN